jgi:hypothetical protein
MESFYAFSSGSTKSFVRCMISVRATGRTNLLNLAWQVFSACWCVAWLCI